MSGIQFRDPVRAIATATVYASALVRVSETGTNDLVSIFADYGLTVPLPNPLVADSAGRIPAIYCDPADTYRVRAVDDEGTQLFSQDGITGDLLPLARTYADPRDDNGVLMPAGVRTFYAAETTELVEVYDDDTLTTPLANPVIANEDGEFADVYLNPELAYRALLHDGSGRLIYDVLVRMEAGE